MRLLPFAAAAARGPWTATASLLTTILDLYRFQALGLVRRLRRSRVCAGRMRSALGGEVAVLTRCIGCPALDIQASTD